MLLIQTIEANVKLLSSNKLVKVILFNFGDSDFKITAGDRIAQFIIETVTDTEAFEVTDDLDSTDRGAGGFGSTGVSKS